MSAITGLFRSQALQQQVYTGIPIQTSALGVPITLAYGVVRITGNLIDYGDFAQVPGSGSSKIGGGISNKGSGSNTFVATILMALCEGPVSLINGTWLTKNPTAFNLTGMGLVVGNYSQSPLPYVQSFHPSHARGYTGIAYVYGIHINLGSNAQLPQMSFEVAALLSNSLSPASDADPSLVLVDMMTDPRRGAGFPASKVGSMTAYQAYCLGQGFHVSVLYASQQPTAQLVDELAAATNSAPLWRGTSFTIVPYGDVTLGAYVPPVTPVFVLTNDDLMQSQGGNTPPEDPVSWTRQRPSDRINHIKVEFADSASGYNTGIAEYKLQHLIDLYGLRSKTAGGNKLFRNAATANISAQLQLQRLSVMTTCTFTVDARYCWLEPMDIVSVPDPDGNQVPVRINRITENDDGTFTIDAEEFLQGMGTVSLSGSGPSAGVPARVASTLTPNASVASGSVTSTLIYQPPAALIQASAQNQLWFGGCSASGGGAAQNLNWGGAQVWVSIDGGGTYGQVATITAPLRVGALSGALASYGGANPDNVDQPIIDMTASNGALEAAGSVAASTFTSLCLIDSELFSYSGSTLTDANLYQLSTLYRGLYGTSAGAHSNGAPFARLDQALAVWDLPPGRYAGITLNVKFLSFNIFGQAIQSLADVPAFTFTPA